MRHAVEREAAVAHALDDRRRIAGEQPDPDEPLGLHQRRLLLDLLVRRARPDERHRLRLRVEDDVVNRPLLGGEAAVDRVGARDVRRVHPVLGPGIVQENLAILHLAAALVVVENARVGARADDRGIRHARCPAAIAEAVESGLHLELPLVRRRRLHRAHVALRRHLRRTPQEFQVLLVLDDAHLVDHAPRIHDRRRARVVGPQVLVQGLELRRPILVVAVGEIEPLDADEIAAGLEGGLVEIAQLFVKVLQGKGRVRSVGGRRLVRSDPHAGPRLAAQVAGPDEDHVPLSVRGVWPQNRGHVVGRDAREVVEVRVLAVDVLDVVRHRPHRSGAQDRNGLRRQLRHEPLPSRLECRRVGSQGRVVEGEQRGRR